MNEHPAAVSRLTAAGPADRSHSFCGCGFSVRRFYERTSHPGFRESKNRVSMPTVQRLLPPCRKQGHAGTIRRLSACASFSKRGAIRQVRGYLCAVRTPHAAGTVFSDFSAERRGRRSTLHFPKRESLQRLCTSAARLPAVSIHCGCRAAR